MCKDLVDEWVLVTEDEISLAVYNMLQEHCKVSQSLSLLKGAGSRNVNKLLSKRRFCNTFDKPYNSDFPLLFSK